jgi:hypothetical protein
VAQNATTPEKKNVFHPINNNNKGQYQVNPQQQDQIIIMEVKGHLHAHLVKNCVGGVNALTLLKRDASMTGMGERFLADLVKRFVGPSVMTSFTIAIRQSEISSKNIFYYIFTR